MLVVVTACGPKGMAEDSSASAGDTSTGETSNPSGATSDATTGVATQTDPTGVIGECEPGDTKPSEGDCSPDCTCSPAGMWLCPEAFGCGVPGTTSTTEATTTTTGTSTGGESTAGESTETTGGGALLLPTCDELAPSDDFTIDKAAIGGDLLVANVTYGGGCEKHDFVLCQAGFKDGVVLLGLDHDAHGDLCDALIAEERQLDLTPLQVLGSPVQISLAGWQFLLEYTF